MSNPSPLNLSSLDLPSLISSLVFHIVLGCWMSAAKVSIFLYFLVHPGIPLAAMLALAFGMLTVLSTGRNLFTFFLIIGSYLVCGSFFMEANKDSKAIGIFSITAWGGLIIGIAINFFVPIVGTILLKAVKSGLALSN